MVVRYLRRGPIDPDRRIGRGSSRPRAGHIPFPTCPASAHPTTIPICGLVSRACHTPPRGPICTRGRFGRRRFCPAREPRGTDGHGNPDQPIDRDGWRLSFEILAETACERFLVSPSELTVRGDFGAALGAARLGMIASGDVSIPAACTLPNIDQVFEPEPRFLESLSSKYERFGG